MGLEELACARVGDHALEPVAHLDAGEPRLGEDEDHEAGVVAGRPYLPVGGGLRCPRGNVAVREIAIHVDDDLRPVIVEQSPGPFARERRFDDACAIDKRLLGLRQRRRRGGIRGTAKTSARTITTKASSDQRTMRTVRSETTTGFDGASTRYSIARPRTKLASGPTCQ